MIQARDDMGTLIFKCKKCGAKYKVETKRGYETVWMAKHRLRCTKHFKFEDSWEFVKHIMGARSISIQEFEILPKMRGDRYGSCPGSNQEG